MTDRTTRPTVLVKHRYCCTTMCVLLQHCLPPPLPPSLLPQLLQSPGCMPTRRCFRRAPCTRVDALKQNAVSQNSITILQFKAMSGSSDDDDDDVPPIRISNAPQALSFPDRLNGRRVSLALVPNGMLQSPKQLREPIISPLKFFKRHKWFFANHRRQQALPPIGTVVAECSPCGRVRLMLTCVAFACQRLATALADMHMTFMSWSWAEVVMERVTRGRVKKVQVRLQRRACCAVRCACRASACVRCVFDACCRKRWLVLRCVAAHHRSGCIKRAAAFIVVCRLLLPPALQVDPTFYGPYVTETAFRCFAI